LANPGRSGYRFRAPLSAVRWYAAYEAIPFECGNDWTSSAQPSEGHRVISEASAFLARLQGTYRNTDIDWEGLLEADYLALLSGRDDLGIIDVGGHAGRHSRVILERLKPSRLLIFEPLPNQREALEAGFAHDPNVTVYGCALGSQRGQSTFVIKRGAPEESGLRQRSFYNDGKSDDLESITVAVETLDGSGIPFRVDFIKIDAEGGEIDILKGADNLLHRDKPIISVEYGPGGYDVYGYEPETLFEFSTKLGYSIFDLFGHRFASIDEWRSCVARFYWDYLLIPDCRVPILTDRIELIRLRSERFIEPPRAENKEILVLEERLAATLAELAGTQAELASTRERLLHVSNLVDALQRSAMELASTRERLLHVSNFVDALQRSTSWRITAPLRHVKVMFGGRGLPR
jgi:FkbM family methyltransferase